MSIYLYICKKLYKVFACGLGFNLRVYDLFVPFLGWASALAASGLKLDNFSGASSACL